MTILVAGATGLAGSAIHRELVRLDRKVLGVSSKDVDLLNREETFNFIRSVQPRVVIDAAAKVGGIKANSNFPAEFLSQNLQIQTNLIDACYEFDVDRVIFLGSSCIYPKKCPQPIKEEYILSGPLEETNSAYALAKIAGIELIKSYRKEYGRNWISVMPTNLYGPNDNFDLENSHVFPALIRKFVEAVEFGSEKVTLWGSGLPRREFLHVEDLARAIIVCLDNYDGDEHINIGSGWDLSIKELATKISLAAGFTGEIEWDRTKSDGTFQKLLNIDKILALGWSPNIEIDSGIKCTIDWFKSKYSDRLS